MTKILLFTGAGFCVPLGLPIATGFNQVIENVYPDVKVFLDQYLGDKKNDIEKVLELLENFSDENLFSDFLIRKRYGNNQTNKQLISDFYNLKHESREAVGNIKRNLYKVLNNFDLDKSINLYHNLLAEIKNVDSNSAISFFTTNYDLTFEKSISKSAFLEHQLNIYDVVFGFSSKFGSTTFERGNSYVWKPELMEYQKLHGSLDWVKDNFGQVTKSGSSLMPANPEETPLLYPGYKGVPIEDPFLTIHDNLFRKASEADIIICIGFAFRDPYINNIFESTLRYNKDLVVFCFNPADVRSLPEESKIRHFVRDYGNFRYIKKGIEIKNYPLGLRELINESNNRGEDGASDSI